MWAAVTQAISPHGSVKNFWFWFTFAKLWNTQLLMLISAECGSFSARHKMSWHNVSKRLELKSDVRLMTAPCALCVIEVIFLYVGVCSIFTELSDLHFFNEVILSHHSWVLWYLMLIQYRCDDQSKMYSSCTPCVQMKEGNIWETTESGHWRCFCIFTTFLYTSFTDDNPVHCNSHIE